MTTTRSATERIAALGSLIARLQRCVAASGDIGGRPTEHRIFDAQLRELEADVEAECDRLTAETLTTEHVAKTETDARRGTRAGFNVRSSPGTAASTARP